MELFCSAKRSLKKSTIVYIIFITKKKLYTLFVKFFLKNNICLFLFTKHVKCITAKFYSSNKYNISENNLQLKHIPVFGFGGHSP